MGLDASVLVSKSAGRYRVQSSSLEGIWLLADELVRRLYAHFNSASRAHSTRALARPVSGAQGESQYYLPE